MASRRRGHQWQPIADLPADWARWRSPELSELVAQWHRRRSALPEPGVRAFLAKLVRSWSIETGILERIYTLDESVTRTLVKMGFDAAYVSHGSSDLPAGRLLAILEDHQRVAEGLFAFVSGKRELNTSYVHELHVELLRHQDTVEAIDSLGQLREIQVLRGQWKQLPNNPGDLQTGTIRHEYCSPVQVASEMDRLLHVHRTHTEVPFEIEAAFLHHRFTQIHPYQDGNGRVARALATLVCLRAGSLPLRIDRSQKGIYIQALEAADTGDLGPLIGLFRDQQRGDLLQALQLGSPELNAGRKRA